MARVAAVSRHGVAVLPCPGGPELEPTRRDEAHRRLVAEIEARGVDDPRVLEAMASVPRHAFVSGALVEFAYDDTPLPIGAGQTVSQPYMVALIAQWLDLQPTDHVLEVGTGSGYAAAVYARLAREVFTIERYEALAEDAERRLWALGIRNVQVKAGDGTEGWPDAGPFDAIAVAAGGPTVPRSLKLQLKVGGRMIIPIGSTRDQSLLRIRRTSLNEFEEEDLGEVRFVPLVGKEGWGAEHAQYPTTWRRPVQEVVQDAAEPFTSVDQADLAPLLARIGDARVVLLGEASHGTSEFYGMRARITKALVEEKGFHMVCVEADWPDAARIDQHVRGLDVPAADWTAFARFPTWMWRNEDVRGLVDDLHRLNMKRPPGERVAFRGLDLYSLYTSIHSVIQYLEEVDPHAADVARQRYGCLSPWEGDPAAYGRAATLGAFDDCEDEVVAMLEDLLERRRGPVLGPDGDRLLDALQNARLVQGAEQYYRIMYRGGRSSWNLRDTHMFETLDALLADRGPTSKAVVWAHNSHLGDARYTEMSRRGEHNLGQLCKETWGNLVYSIGFGTHTGTVAAADGWGGVMKIKQVRPSHAKSYERLMHETRLPGFFLPLTDGPVRARLMEPRLERAIGVIYRPETELASHYFQAVLPKQFDEYVWIDETEAVRPLTTETLAGVPETYPFGV